MIDWEIIKHFFHHDQSITGELIVGSYDVSLVIISLIVPIVMSLMALHAANIARIVRNTKAKHLSITVSSLALGTGIWAMHFIGMLAFKLPAAVGYSTGLTLASIFPSLLASWLAIRVLASPKVNLSQLLFGGFLVGLGIGSMHFVGMAAMQTELIMTHEFVQVLWSVVIAVILAMLALWINFGLRPYIRSTLFRFVLSSVVMGVAIAGMHYMAMTAVRFYGEPKHFQETIALNYKLVAYAIASISIAIGLIVFALNNYYKTTRMYELLDESKLRLRAIIDTVVDAIITINSKGLIEEFSPAAERLFGYSASEVFGKNVKMLMPEPYRSEHDGYLENYLRTKKPRIIGTGRDVTAQKKDGTLFPIRLSVGKIELPNKDYMFVGLITDISLRIQLENQLRETAEKAEKAAKIKSNFLANMSHEIRTPMNAIIGFTELLMDSDLNDKQRSQLNIVHQSSNSLLRLINDILVNSKLESGNVELENLDFSLQSIAMQLQSTLNLAAEKNNIYLKVHYQENMPVYFNGDSLRLLQVLNNLVGNALKFTETGGVDVYFGYEEPNVIIKVKDTGIGMTPEQIQGIFNPFNQADASINRRFGGTGLGTTIARQLVHTMKGHIRVTSTFGQGSEFTVILPLQIGEKPQEDVNEIDLMLEPLKILAVDDVNDNLELLEIILHENGHTVTRANDGQEAFDRYLKSNFDLILMDVHMPGIDGLQATQMIRQHERNNNISPMPIIALSASVLNDDKVKALKSGMSGFAQKPINLLNLFTEICKVIKVDNNTEPNATHLQANDLGAQALTKEIDFVSSINWKLATSLWGSKHVLVRKISNLLDEVKSKYPIICAAKDNIDKEKLKLELHGFRGVAGNLGLDNLFNLMSRLEQNIDTINAVDLINELDNIRLSIQKIATEVAQEKGLDINNSVGLTNDVENNSEKESVDIASLKLNIEKLIISLKSFEYDDELLSSVCDDLRLMGHYDDARKVRCSAEEFNFDRACSVLEGLHI